MIDRNSFLWSYLQPELKELITDGEILLEVMDEDVVRKNIKDFSFLVFPFSKAYEGFLKKLFLDIGLIHYDEYYGDEIRIGRLLNPHYKHEKESLFTKMCSHSPQREKLSGLLWDVWKNGRNLVFHYFPHNYKKLTYQEAVAEAKDILKAMEAAVLGCGLVKNGA